VRSLAKLLAVASILAGVAALIRAILDRQERGPAPANASEGAIRPGPATHHGEPTRNELYEEAKHLDIEGRSAMNKAELGRAVEAARGSGS
jgi:hypothetical protein